ncbi:uncharacterized protein LOC135217543 [Macrobrachium nipponense]|uniref:uncharacterized protein LOC135217543 n=1 Tax=Macrobrachium nipponense TaxID=159736 RepID=UPI0030C8541C
MVRRKYGDLLVDREEIEERWVEHFRTLLNRTAPLEQPGENGEIILGEDGEESTTEEILEIINHLKTNNSAGLDEISAELLKYGGRQLQEAMAKIVIEFWRREEIPEEWEEGLFVPIHKKGDRTECGNYRGICLLTVGYKIEAKLLYNRLKRHNFKQAYDSIQREALWRILREFRIPEKLIRLTKMCYRNMRGRVQIGGEVTGPFEVDNGLKQECALSMIPFNLVLEWVMRQTPEGNGVHFGEAMCDRLAYADDIDFCGENIQETDIEITIFREAANKVGLEIKEAKTKILKVSRQERILGNIRRGNMELEAVKNFKYLGSTVTAENRVEEEVKLRIVAAARCIWALVKVLNNNILSRRTKVKAYTTII